MDEATGIGRCVGARGQTRATFRLGAAGLAAAPRDRHTLLANKLSRHPTSAIRMAGS
jgi:hypothetical protein